MLISTSVCDYYINVLQIQWIKHIGNYEYEIKFSGGTSIYVNYGTFKKVLAEMKRLKLMKEN